MLVGNLAITLNLLSIAVLAFAISVVFIAVISPFTLHRIALFTFGIRKVILWSLVTAPWWIAISCIGFFWPRQQYISLGAWLNDFAHWHHVDLFSFTSWHAVTLFSASAYLLWSMANTVYIRRKQSSAIADLIGLSDIKFKQTNGKQGYYSLPLSKSGAFTTGLLSPKIYVTTALEERVNKHELDIIICHEIAHVESRDPLLKVAFAAFAVFFPATVKRKLIQQFTLLTEQVADSAVTKKYDNLDVAQTLINVARMQRSIDSMQNNCCDGLQTSYFGNDQTSVRVQCLINPVTSPSRLAVGFAIILFASAPLLTASTVDSLHHIIETFFTH